MSDKLPPRNNRDQRALFANSYTGRRVFITGHTGFKGSWLTLWLQAMGAKVTGYALAPPTNPSLFEAIDLSSRIGHVIGDVRDQARLVTVMQAARPEVVFHLAAQPLVRLSYQEPRLTYETNVMGTVNLLEAVRATPGVRAVVIVTSDKCYENMQWDYAYRENDPPGGADPYSSSKGCAELVASAYYRSFFTNPDAACIATVRAGNVVGGGDWAADRLIPDCIRALYRGEPIVIRNPHSIRPWQHVLEPLAGYLWLGAKMLGDGHDYAGPWNFGPDAQSNVTVAEVAEMVLEAWGAGTWSVSPDEKAQPHEARLLKLDCTKAKNLLGWYPILDIKQTIADTVSWYRDYYGGSSTLREITTRQIEDYIRQAKQLSI